ncbi:MAG: type II toxin-antitoxin system PemK/MazF family toxin, partial [Planctomycetota bacterium]
MKCGSVCLTQFPFTNGTSAKMRPVLVVSKDEFNAGEDVVVV